MAFLLLVPSSPAAPPERNEAIQRLVDAVREGRRLSRARPGARVLATKAPFADEIFIYPAHPLPPNSPEAYAIAFSIPIATHFNGVFARLPMN